MAVRMADLPGAVRLVVRREKRALGAALTWCDEARRRRAERRAVYRALSQVHDGRATGARV